MFHIAARCARPSHKLPTTPVCNAAHTPPQYGSDMNITFDGWDIYAGPRRLQREIVLPLQRGSLHCIVPNYEIEKFNKWSVVKFIFHRLVRYHCFPDVWGRNISHLPSAVRYKVHTGLTKAGVEIHLATEILGGLKRT